MLTVNLDVSEEQSPSDDVRSDIILAQVGSDIAMDRYVIQVWFGGDRYK